jgi:hypothetical protein
VFAAYQRPTLALPIFGSKKFWVEPMFRNKLLVLSFYAGQVFAADSRPIPLHETESQFRDFIASLKVAAQKKNLRAVYAVLAPDYYIARDFGGSFDPSASPTRNFSANFEFNNDNLRSEYKNFGWVEFTRAISGRSFERKRDGQLCTPHGALDKKPFPYPQLCFRKFKDGWKIQGYINGGD